MKRFRIAVLYRVSTTKQLKTGQARKDGKESARQINAEEDLQLQSRTCEEYIEKKKSDGWEFTGIEYVEGGVSAFKTHSSRRKELMRAYEDAKNGLYDILLVYKLDRFGRRSSESLEYALKFLKWCRIWVVDKDREFTNNGDADEIINFIEFWSAKKASSDTKIRVTDAMKVIHKDGYWTGGVAPFGYRNHTTTANMLETVSEEATQVKLIFEKYVYEGMGFHKIANWLNENGYKPRVAEFWKQANLSKILANSIYKGYLSYHKTTQVEGEFGSYQTRQAKEHWSISTKKWDEYAIISEELWNKAQEIKEQRKLNRGLNQAHESLAKSAPTRKGTGQLLFSGFIYCANCNGPMVAKHETSRWYRDGVLQKKPYIVYKCLNRLQGGKTGCDAEKTSVKREIIENAIINQVKAFTKELSQSPFLSDLKEFTQRNKKALTQEYQLIVSEIGRHNQAKEKSNQLLMKLMTGDSIPFSEQQISEMYRTSTEKLKELNKTLAHLNDIRKQEDLGQGELDELSHIVNQWSNFFDVAELQTKKEMISKLVDKITVYSSKVVVEFNVRWADLYETMAGARLEISASLDQAEETHPTQQLFVNYRNPNSLQNNVIFIQNCRRKIALITAKLKYTLTKHPLHRKIEITLASPKTK